MKRALKRECRRQLKDTFGLEGFRPGQKAAAYALLSGRDLLCVLPTGAGKSLCWQLPAVVRGGLTVVLSPLIALMRDQVQHLEDAGIPAVTLNSLMPPQEQDAAMQRLLTGEADILFISPERLGNAALLRLFTARPPWLVVVDEAHCIVQWGGEFRPAYAAIGEFIRGLPHRPVVCAMTATADGDMQSAIADSLQMNRFRRVTLPLVRENLAYDVRTTLDKTGEILRMAAGEPQKTVVFCRSRARTEQLASLLQRQGCRAEHYHAGMDREQRESIQQRFMDGEILILTATSAFGMGVDIPDVRRVVHDYLPASLTDYVQQAGRAGRDGQDAACILLVEPGDVAAQSGALNREWMRLRFHPIRRLQMLKNQWKPRKQLLETMLTSRCIAASITRAFGRRSPACGRCTSCRRGALLHRVPPLPVMTQQQVIAFFLRWQRDAIARQQHVRPRRVMSSRVLSLAAKRLYLPENSVPCAQQMQRLLDHFLKKKTHEADAERIS